MLGLVRSSLAAFCLFMAAGQGLHGALPPKPADGIRDDARAMTAEAHQALAEEIRAFEKRTGMVIVIDTNTFLEQGVTSGERCRALVAEWIGKKPGVVFCLNRGAKPVPFIVYSAELFDRYPEPDLTQAAGETTEAMAKVATPENRLPVGVRVMMGRLTALEKTAARRNHMFLRRELEMMAGFCGFLLVAGAITWVIVRYRGRHEQAAAVQHRFPDVEVAQRFGAPSGGGIVAEVTYVRGAP